MKQARLLPMVHDGAAWLVEEIPAEHRPKVAPLPSGRETTSEDLLHITPQGRALGKPAPATSL